MAGGKTREQNQARFMRAHGKSLNEIATKLGVAKSSASNWVCDIHLTAEQRKKLKNRELRGGAKGRRKINIQWHEYRKLHPKPKPKSPRWPKRSVDSFFDAWTPEMAYVLGFFAADGCMYKNKRGSHYVAFYSTDPDLIKNIKQIMNVHNNIETYISTNPGLYGLKKKYTLQIGSRQMFNRLTELGFTPNKSLTMKLPDIPRNVLCHFTRGYLDGDGCVSFGIYARQNRPNPIAVLSVRFICGSKPFLTSLHKCLNQVTSLKGGGISKHSRAYRLYYSTRDSRLLYNFMYPTPTVPCLERKRKKFKEAFSKLP